MDPDDSFDVLERSPYYFLSEDDGGFSLWSVVGEEADDPVLTFPPGEGGRAQALAAFRRETRFGRWARVFFVVAFVAAPIWLVSELLLRWAEVFGRDAFTGFESHVDRVQLWSNVVGSVANAAFFIAVGLSLVIWLHRRYRREG